VPDPNIVAVLAIATLATGLFVLATRSRLGARFPGSFGQGFLPYRGDGWPPGVQEDDDAQWSWAGRRDEVALGAAASGERWHAPHAVSPQRPVPPTRPQRS
jgi:hypothetical protein